MTPDLRYPIGRFETVTPGSSTITDRAAHIANIAALPANLRAAVHGLSDAQLDTPYRPGGWTVRQLVHHVADSHANAYCRIKLALTEENPTIKPYDEERWAMLPDATLPIEVSLVMLEAIHERWVTLLEALEPAQYHRLFTHPEAGGHDVDWLLALYDWHGRHHTAHLTALRTREGF